MPKIIEVHRFAIRLEDGTEIVLPRYDYIHDFSGNFAVMGKKNSEGFILEGAINEYGEEFIPIKYVKLSSTLYKYKRIEKFIPEKDIVVVLDKNGYRAINLVNKEELFICNKDEELPEDFS